MSEAVLRITVEDLVSGEKEVAEIPAGEYVVTCTEPCHVDGVQAYSSGTVVLTIKNWQRRKPTP